MTYWLDHLQWLEIDQSVGGTKAKDFKIFSVVVKILCFSLYISCDVKNLSSQSMLYI